MSPDTHSIAGMTEGRTRFDQQLAALGPDVLADELDGARFLRRLRADDPTRGIGDALLDQTTIAGIGNLWKSEACLVWARGQGDDNRTTFWCPACQR